MFKQHSMQDLKPGGVFRNQLIQIISHTGWGTPLHRYHKKFRSGVTACTSFKSCQYTGGSYSVRFTTQGIRAKVS